MAKYGNCPCCASYKKMPLYPMPTIMGIREYCAPCCRSLGYKPRSKESFDTQLYNAIKQKEGNE